METIMSTQESTIAVSHEAAVAALLSDEAVAFLTGLQRRFNLVREQLLEERIQQQSRIDAGILPDFLSETEHIRNGGWEVDPLPLDLRDRRVEITGPVDRKMIINALNSRSQNVYGRFRRQQYTDLVQPGPGPTQLTGSGKGYHKSGYR